MLFTAVSPIKTTFTCGQDKPFEKKNRPHKNSLLKQISIKTKQQSKFRLLYLHALTVAKPCLKIPKTLSPRRPHQTHRFYPTTTTVSRSRSATTWSRIRPANSDTGHYNNRPGCLAFVGGIRMRRLRDVFRVHANNNARSRAGKNASRIRSSV